MMSEKSGSCLCGAVRFTARNVPTSYGICHCEMCRRWTGSALVEVSVSEQDVTWQGAENIATHTSSSWAERAFCRQCGTGLYFRNTQDGEWSGKYDLPIGLFDDASGFTLNYEIYIDHKPDSYAYVGSGHRVLTRADCVAKNPILDTE